MKFWQPNSTKTIEWGNCKQHNEIDYWPLLRHCAPGRHRLILQCQNTTLPENFTPKIIKPANISSFDLLHMDVLAAIENWIIDLKYHDRFKYVLS